MTKEAVVEQRYASGHSSAESDLSKPVTSDEAIFIEPEEAVKPKKKKGLRVSIDLSKNIIHTIPRVSKFSIFNREEPVSAAVSVPTKAKVKTKAPASESNPRYEDDCWLECAKYEPCYVM